MAATLERLWLPRAWSETGSLTSAFYFGDARRFFEYAIAILQGRSFDNGIPFHPPGWPLLLAAFLRVASAITGAAPVDVPVAAIKAFIAALSGLSVGITVLVTYEMAGVGAALAVSLLGPLHFGHIVQGTVANSEALYSLCVATFMWASWKWLADPGSLRWSAIAGAVAAAGMLVRAEFLAAAVALPLYVWLRARRHPPADGGRAVRVDALAAFALTFAVALTPTTIWHWRTLSAFNTSHVGRVAGPLPRLAPITSYGPFNFAMANHPDADGGPNRDHPMMEECNQETDARLSAGQLDLACPSIYELYVSGYRIGLAWIVNHPSDALALVWRKIEYTVGFLSYGYSIDDRGAGIDGIRRRVDMLDPTGVTLIPLHLGLAVAGIWVLWRNPEALAVTLAPLAALAGSVVLFYGYVRLGVAYLPAVWLLQGAALATLVGKFAARQRAGERAVRAAAATLIALTLLVAYDGVSARASRRLQLDGVTSPGGVLVQDETVEVHEIR